MVNDWTMQADPTQPKATAREAWLAALPTLVTERYGDIMSTAFNVERPASPTE